MKIGYVYIIVEPEKQDKIVLGYSDFLPRKVLQDYRDKTDSTTAELEWLQSFSDSYIAFQMIQYKLAPYKSYVEEMSYNIRLDTALSIFLKPVAEFFDMFKMSIKICWRINKYITYEELCARSSLELMYPLLHRSYIRNKLIIRRRQEGLDSET